ncbi:Imm49 family immunity protein [Pyxidicoccus sp. MSG2]|uniref:Imm49 family immunity protein n=1 Tax=Pyxidicoccus sp. MSG2 TaxID=2996790 RepID=UPI002270D020|nr:Imm49 family immunity protein [Pyxidicoccus sp. MSG2]MCY1018044.1 Imm49 family immunity protein [Pyxidicoccus sp. MSG2]
MSLHALQQRLMEELQEHLAVIATGHPAAEVGEVYEEVEQYFQATASCALLVAADKASFQKHLCWSALARRDFLRRSRDEGSTGNFRRARSRGDALFCAAAAGDMRLAIEIGDLSPSTWNPEGEYEDDFAYHFFLHQFMKGAPSSEREVALLQLDKALSGPASPRLEVCQALHDGALEAFEMALQAVIDSYAAEQEKARAHSTDIPTFEPRSRLFIEGFALLRIAANAGLQPAERDYRLCPVLGRVKPLRDRPDDIFAELASLSPARRGPPST